MAAHSHLSFTLPKKVQSGLNHAGCPVNQLDEQAKRKVTYWVDWLLPLDALHLTKLFTKSGQPIEKIRRKMIKHTSTG
ncbi:hypothetical protein Pmani_000022 [Petrolisthes manimaculis]|uniref:Uncharacterized protein n=1 Tax=Petrolisthes manimaculis TaxID=1843537 RepID=A0AAE1QMH0_9EUCA|nr:hypothetical protein Pmani_000022 [Petrolisthes manimaculis]